MKGADAVHRGSNFFPLVQLLERMLPGNQELGAASSPGGEKIRFTAKKGFGYPPADVTAVRLEEEVAAEVEVAMMGLIGPSGVLPHWYHELVLERERDGDRAMGDFYDLFQHRLISLFYRAWKRNSLLPQKKNDNSDIFSGHLLSFLGLGTEGLREPLAASEAALLHFSGQASKQAASAGMIAHIVKSVFGVDVEVEPFVPRVVSLEPSDVTTLGQTNCRLGIDTVCGNQTCDVQSTFRLCLGPLGYRQFLELSSARKLKHLISLVRFLAGPEFEFEVRLVLKKEEVPCCRLDVPTADAPRLGQSTWIKAPGIIHDTDSFLSIHPDQLVKLKV